MRVAFLGFGLIAGSIARAVRAAPDAVDWTMAAWSPSGAGPALAAGDDTIDLAAASPAIAIRGADLVLLAAPVPACLTLMDDLAADLGDVLEADALVTDVASTKAMLVQRADALGLRYVGGHPMAGMESSGYAAGRADLFVDRPWVIVPSRSAWPGDAERVQTLARMCGARPIQLEASVHDRVVAGVSHLPLLLAAALVEAVAGRDSSDVAKDWSVAAPLAASGWRDMTRLAHGDPAMGAGLMATNSAALAERLRDLEAVLRSWRSELDRADGPDPVAIEERLRAAAASLDAS
jgi:prephenate dehydrogenase